MNLGESLRQVRVKKGFNQKSFCKKIGVSQSYLSLVERNKKTPSVEILKKISKGVGMPVAILWWFTFEENDVETEKVEKFRLLKPSIDNLITEIFN